jgi:hypothetical protein
MEQSSSVRWPIVLAMALSPSMAASQTGRGLCSASQNTLTPSSWRGSAMAPQPRPRSGFSLVAEVALPGPANRFDYQSIDSTTRRLYMNHMNAGRTLVFDLDAGRIVGEIKDVPVATGVWAVPQHHAVYISAAGAHAVAIADDRTLAVVSRVSGIRFPDGIGYAPDVDKVFVSDESGGTDVVIDAKTRLKRSTIRLGGEAGNTHYDAVSHCVLVAVQTRNQVVAIDPATEQIVARYDVPGCKGPHGFTIDELDRLAFISCEANAALLVFDLRNAKFVERHKVADDPDVLAWDPGWKRLYVATESGVVSAWWLNGSSLSSIGEILAPRAHTVAVDPRTHRIYLPLENVNGKAVLRIFVPAH